MYKKCPNNWNGSPPSSVLRLDDGACIPFAVENTDYQQFKSSINDESAQLEDADGVLMTPDEAKAYVATLP
jgi:hypothetical protein